jgi:hypothetical protein
MTEKKTEKIGFLHSKINIKTREQWRLNFEKKITLDNPLIYKSSNYMRIQILVATIEIYGIGLNLPRAYKYVLMEPDFMKRTKN